MIKNTFQNIIQITKVSFKKKIFRLISSKSTSYPSYTVYSKQYNNNEEKENVHSGGFKRNHIDNETRSKYNCENEQWFSKQLNSGENYDVSPSPPPSPSPSPPLSPFPPPSPSPPPSRVLNNIVNEDGYGSKLFPYKYGNSFYEYTNKDLKKKIRKEIDTLNEISMTNTTNYNNENNCNEYDDEYDSSKMK